MLASQLFQRLTCRPDPAGIDVLESSPHRCDGVRPFFVALILDFPIQEGLIQGETVAPVGELGTEKIEKRSRIVHAVCGHDSYLSRSSPRIVSVIVVPRHSFQMA